MGLETTETERISIPAPTPLPMPVPQPAEPKEPVRTARRSPAATTDR